MHPRPAPRHPGSCAFDARRIRRQFERRRLARNHGDSILGREQRLDQVKKAMDKLGEDATVGQIVDEIYTDVDPVLRHAAEQSTRVTMRYLQSQ